MYRKFGKRIIDFSLASICIILLAIPMLVIAALIKLDDPGPVIFRQKRVGIHKTYFNILKFRTMKMKTHIIGSILIPFCNQIVLIPQSRPWANK